MKVSELKAFLEALPDGADVLCMGFDAELHQAEASWFGPDGNEPGFVEIGPVVDNEPSAG